MPSQPVRIRRRCRPAGRCRYGTSTTRTLREAIRHAPRDTTVAVIATDDAADHLVSLIDVPGSAVIPASFVNPLKYDQVTVVEPADIVTAEPRGRTGCSSP